MGHDREVIAWRAIAGGGIGGSDIHGPMLRAGERRYDTVRAPAHVEWLSDDGSPYTTKETRQFAARFDLVPRFTPVASPERNGMGEAFVQTFKRDHVRASPLPDAKTALEKIP